MLDKTQQPTASLRRATGQQAHERKRGRTWPLPGVLAVLIAVLALAAPASAAGPVTGLLNTVAKAATPAVTQAVPAAAPVDPSPPAAQQAGNVASAPAPVVPTPSSHTVSSVSAAGSELPTATSHHDQTAGGASAYQPESAPRPAEGPHAAGSTPPRAAGSADNAGAATSTASAQHPSEPGDRVAVLAKQITDSAAHTTGVVLPAHRGERKPLPSRLLGAARTATPGQHLGLAPALLGDSHAIGDVGETARRLVGSTPATIAPLLTPLTRAVPLSSLPQLTILPELATLPELPSLLTLPVLPALPMLPALPGLPTLPELAELQELPSLPVLTSVLPTLPAPAELIALSSPAGPARGDDAGSSTATAQQGAWQAPNVQEAYAGIRGVTGAAPGLPGSTSSAATAPEAWAPGSTASAYGLSASAGSAQATRGTTSPRGAYQQPSPTPSPGGISTATGAVGGTSIPIFLTLAGLLLLATPRVRRVLRLLGESWRLSPLALIPERPG